MKKTLFTMLFSLISITCFGASLSLTNPNSEDWIRLKLDTPFAPLKITTDDGGLPLYLGTTKEFYLNRVTNRFNIHDLTNRVFTHHNINWAINGAEEFVEEVALHFNEYTSNDGFPLMYTDYTSSYLSYFRYPAVVQISNQVPEINPIAILCCLPFLKRIRK